MTTGEVFGGAVVLDLHVGVDGVAVYGKQDVLAHLVHGLVGAEKAAAGRGWPRGDQEGQQEDERIGTISSRSRSGSRIGKSEE